MRDPNRIHKILRIIGVIWEQAPDLRLMQLLQNAIGHEDNYNLEDDELLKKLDELYNKQLEINNGS